jgi:hypothetical protein
MTIENGRSPAFREGLRVPIGLAAIGRAEYEVPHASRVYRQRAWKVEPGRRFRVWYFSNH